MAAGKWPAFLYDANQFWDLDDINKGLLHSYFLLWVSSCTPISPSEFIPFPKRAHGCGYTCSLGQLLLLRTVMVQCLHVSRSKGSSAVVLGYKESNMLPVAQSLTQLCR